MSSYLIAPFAAYLCAGGAKFLVNSLSSGRPAFAEVGLGGFPSTHCAITGSCVTLIGLRDGVDNPAFGLSIAFSLIVAIDAMDLRRKVGAHAKALRELGAERGIGQGLRLRTGHTALEVAGGLITGAGAATVVNMLKL